METIFKLPNFEALDKELTKVLTFVKDNQISVSKAKKRINSMLQSELNINSSEKKRVKDIVKKYFEENKNGEKSE